jgi:tetratricopeptide (TPR) repeat protein
MSIKLLHRIFGAASFLLTLIVYTLTVQPSVPFWDTGEFTSAAIWQQVPHPPGAPLFLIIGKVFHLFIPFGDPAWRVNMVSVVTTAVIVLLLYLVTVKVIQAFRMKPIESIGEALSVYGSAFIGAAALCFSDTVWFNGVESEVYAMSLVFVAIIFYLLMKWNEKADERGNEKYILLIMYLIGLSTGVHLLAILTLFTVAMFIYFRKYPQTTKNFILMGLISVVVFVAIYPGIVKWIPALLAGNWPFKNEAKEYIIENSAALKILTVIIIAGIGYLFYYSYKNNKRLLALAASSILLVILGYTTYTQILLRSNANPPMNENEPKTLTRLTSYLGREQYGDDPMWPRRVKNEQYYTQYYTQRDENGNYIYGEWYPPGRKTVTRNDGVTYSIPEFTKVNFWGEMAYLWKYQIDHMYIRYFLWNYVGRVSDVQDAEWTFLDTKNSEEINFGSGYKDEFPIRFYALPLLIGIIGLFFHFNRDKKAAFAYLVAFLMMGVFAAIAQQQQMPQPRERDYFYTGSFFVWCMWIGIGVFGIIEWATAKRKGNAIIAGILGLAMLAVPVNMAIGGWKMHSRAGNYIPFDYSYNILQSLEKNAIVFTNGDNDTFPLWYLQDVAGVRRDVRVVNLSLGNTLWYVDQLKNRSPWGAEKINLSFPDESLQVDDETSQMALSYDFGEPRVEEIPVSPEVMRQFTNDPAVINSGKMSFTYIGKPYQQSGDRTIHLFRVQDKLVLDILKATKFERPVYFSTTVGGDNFVGLDSYFRYEGMAMRICPVIQKTGNFEPVNEEVMRKCLFEIDNSNDYSKTQKYGFKFRNLNNTDVYYDEVHRRLTGTYRHLYLLYAQYEIDKNNDKKSAVEAMDKMNQYISTEQFPLTFDMAFRIATIYEQAGELEKAKRFADLGLASAVPVMDKPQLMADVSSYEYAGRMYGAHRYAGLLYGIKGDYQSAERAYGRLLEIYNSRLQQLPPNSEDYRRVLYASLDVRAGMDNLIIDNLVKQGKRKEAMDSAQALFEKYMNSQDPAERQLAGYAQQKIQELREQDGVKTPDSAANQFPMGMPQ